MSKFVVRFFCTKLSLNFIIESYRDEAPMNKLKIKINFIDITDKWLKCNKNNGKVIFRKYFVDKNNNKYFIDNKNVLYNISEEEIKIAKMIKETLGGNIYLNPKVNEPKYVKSSDYLYKNGYWDLKRIGKNATSEKRAVDNAVKNARNQTDNIIIHINGTIIPSDIIIKQVKELYSTKGREWIDTIIVAKDFKIIKIFKKNKRG